MTPPVLYIVVPCYNEQAVLPETAPMFLHKLEELSSRGKISDESRVLFVNDGSRDDTWRIICDLARQGREVERKPREITIFELELLEQTGPAEWRLRCVCSKGTYIRSLCHDIGQALGCGGCMSGLRRTMAAGFTIDRTVTVETVQERGEAVLLPLDAYFAPYPAYTIPSPGRENRVRNGNPITDARLKDGTYRVYGGDGTFLCLSEAKGGTLTAVKNFFGT